MGLGGVGGGRVWAVGRVKGSQGFRVYRVRGFGVLAGVQAPLAFPTCAPQAAAAAAACTCALAHSSFNATALARSASSASPGPDATCATCQEGGVGFRGLSSGLRGV